MPKPKPGYYRKLLPEGMQDIRIALTAQPMTGVTRRPDLTESLATHFESTEDPYGQFYAEEGLRTGNMVAVVPADCPKVWRPGELFLKS